MKYKTEREQRVRVGWQWRSCLWLPVVGNSKGVWDGWYILLYLKWITERSAVWPGNSVNVMGVESRGKWIHVCMAEPEQQTT